MLAEEMVRDDPDDHDLGAILTVLYMRKEAQTYRNLASEASAATLRQRMEQIAGNRMVPPSRFTVQQVANFTWAGLSLLHYGVVYNNRDYTEVLCECGADLGAVAEDTEQVWQSGCCGQ